MCIISVREVPDFEFKDCLFSAVMKNFDQSLLCFSVGWDILRLFGKIYVNFFSIKSQLQQILCVLGMYALFDAHETSHCSINVSQVLCINWRFLLRYSWLVTRVKFSSRWWGQDSPSKAPKMSLSLRQSLQNLSVERAINVIDRMGAVSACQSSCCDAGFLVDKHFTLFNPGI